ncbi:hypothetical protein ACTFIR_011808, partial [Dictyostelium discoideum]
SYFNFNTIL